MSLLRCEVKLADMRFVQAFEVWLAARIVAKGSTGCRARYIGERTEEDYRQYSVALGKMFFGLRLRDIHDGHLREYQRARSLCDGGWSQPAGQNLIRKEVGMLIRMLKAAAVWSKDSDEAYDRLPQVDTDVKRALDPDQQRRLLEVLQTRMEWAWVFWWTVVSLQTCGATNEIRKLRHRDVDLRNCTLRIGIEGSKNKFRNRTIPLETNEVIYALTMLQRRAREMGSVHDSDFILPFGAGLRGRFDPSKSMSDSGLKKVWNEIRKASDLSWLRPYDIRHTAITRMAEAGRPISVIMAFAGHVSPKMQQHYTTVSMAAKRSTARDVWAGAMNFTPKKPSVSITALNCPAKMA